MNAYAGTLLDAKGSIFVLRLLPTILVGRAVVEEEEHGGRVGLQQYIILIAIHYSDCR